MKANNNPVLFREGEINFEKQELKENRFINSVAKIHLRKAIKEKKQFKEVHILNDMYFVRK